MSDVFKKVLGIYGTLRSIFFIFIYYYTRFSLIGKNDGC